MSSNETYTPKRRSSTGKRRRAPQPEAVAEPTEASVSTTESAVTVETVEENVIRAAERKAAKAQKDNKTGIGRVVDTQRFGAVRQFYSDTMSEIRKVIWPTREQTINLTLLVIALAVVIGSLLGGIDWALLRVFDAIG